ncbi:YeeE/YedE thiosulfate transporter family protein [Thermodesulfobacterium hydrogeniphilum]|uniref:YeeE/YedE thiosulfate transporter family protein n=1 Tax=Thermodesulfobacterium hydrogeniphilum TaxID=161156 RepID=UPI00056DD455|nr:YeeE/YedE thiosulfate transporter family protein [Thermodesulfobacterium hydrogeniphilum]
MDPRLGGVLIGILVVILEYLFYPWGTAQEIKLWGEEFLNLVGLHLNLAHSFNYNLALILGAFFSASFFKEFALKIPSKIEFYKAILAGILMGLGASLALGDNITAFFTSFANLSASSLLMLLGLVIGIYIGVQYQVWELDKYPSLGGKQVRFPKFNLFFAFLGLLGLIFLIKENWILAILAVMGIVLQKSRWCMLNAFKEPFFSEKTQMSQAVIIALLIATTGIGILKMQGLIKNPYLYVFPAFGWTAVAGGILFGIGMMLAGSCSASLLWKFGEGDIKAFITLLFFSITYALNSFLIEKFGDTLFKGEKVYLPDYLTYYGAFGILVLILVIWYGIVFWNSKTKKLIKRYF